MVSAIYCALVWQTAVLAARVVALVVRVSLVALVFQVTSVQKADTAVSTKVFAMHSITARMLAPPGLATTAAATVDAHQHIAAGTKQIALHSIKKKEIHSKIRVHAITALLLLTFSQTAAVAVDTAGNHTPQCLVVKSEDLEHTWYGVLTVQIVQVLAGLVWRTTEQITLAVSSLVLVLPPVVGADLLEWVEALATLVAAIAAIAAALAQRVLLDSHYTYQERFDRWLESEIY